MRFRSGPRVGRWFSAGCAGVGETGGSLCRLSRGRFGSFPLLGGLGQPIAALARQLALRKPFFLASVLGSFCHSQNLVSHIERASNALAFEPSGELLCQTKKQT